jgi:hypothetical protein
MGKLRQDKKGISELGKVKIDDTERRIGRNNKVCCRDSHCDKREERRGDKPFNQNPPLPAFMIPHKPA